MKKAIQKVLTIMLACTLALEPAPMAVFSSTSVVYAASEENSGGGASTDEKAAAEARKKAEEEAAAKKAEEEAKKKAEEEAAAKKAEEEAAAKAASEKAEEEAEKKAADENAAEEAASEKAVEEPEKETDVNAGENAQEEPEKAAAGETADAASSGDAEEADSAATDAAEEDAETKDAAGEADTAKTDDANVADTKQPAEKADSADTKKSAEEADTAATELPAEEAGVSATEEAPAEAPAEEPVEMPAKSFSGGANGVSVTVKAEEGTFPAGTTMKVQYVSSGSVMGAVQDAVEGEVKSVKAVDISFWYKGKEIQPEKPVKVSMSASGMDASLDHEIVHINDHKDSVVETVVEKHEMPGTSGSFHTDSFSIYVVVESDNPDSQEHNAVATYEFYVGDDLVQTQHVKNGDQLSDPGDLAGDGANKVFKGWFIKENGELTDQSPAFGETLTGIEKEETIVVAAKVQQTYYVTFRGEKGANGERGIVQVRTVTVTGEEGETGTVKISDISVTPKSDTSVFEGWSLTDDGLDPIKEDEVEVSGRMELYAIVVDAHWIHFDENIDYETSDSDATYTGPVAVKTTDNLADKQPTPPTRRGYTFDGWYKEPDCTNKFEWSGTGLDSEITLYAKWVPDEATYTVIIWKQKVTDAKDAADADKTYDFESNEKLTGTTGETLDPDDYASYTRKNFTGFHYSRTEIKPETVRADGSTVVNVYYDRNLLTIHFIDSAYGNKDFTGLYGSTLASNGYTWPSDRAWYERRGGAGTRLTFLDAFKFDGLEGVSNNNTVLTQYAANNSGNNSIRFYKQNIDESYPDTPTNTVQSDANGNFTITEKYEGFKAVSYRNGNNGVWTNAHAGSTARTNNLQIRFERQKYSLTFVLDNGNEKTVDGIPYEEVLSKYKMVPDPDPAECGKPHYTFDGWCEDPSGSRQIDWTSTMPAANKVVYAKWVPKQYHVSLDPNGGVISGTQDAEFNVPLDTILSKDSLFKNIKRDDYELVGWFYKNSDGTAGSVYDYGKIEADVNLIAKWRYPGQVKIVYDAAPHGSEAPEDKYLYATDSAVVVGPPPAEIEDGWEFYAWEVDGKKYYPNNTFDITVDLIENYDPETKTGTVTIKALYNDKNAGPLSPTTITFDPGEGSGTPVTVDKSPSDPTKALLVNEKIEAKSTGECGFTAPEGYVFKEWNTDQKGEGLSVDPGEMIAADLFDRDKNSKNNTLYAIWIPKLEIKIEGNSDEKEYNGSEQSVTGFTVKYIVAGKEQTDAPAGVTVALADGKQAEAKGTNVGKYPMGLTAESFSITVPAANYVFDAAEDVKVTDGNLTITKKAVTVTITGNKDSKEYNGKEQKVEGYKAEISEPLYKEADFTFSGEAVAKGTDAGTYPMGLAEDQLANKNENFDVTFKVTDGELKITKGGVPEIVITNDEDDSVIADGEGAEKVYDGKPLSGTAAATLKTTGEDGTEIVTSVPVQYSKDGGKTWSDEAPSITDVGKLEVQVQTNSENVEKATASYTLTVTKRPIKVNDTASKPYTGAEQTLTITADKAEAPTEKEGVVDGEELTLDGAAISGTNVGQYTDVSKDYTWSVAKKDGSDSTGNYTIEVTGKLTITKAGKPEIVVTDNDGEIIAEGAEKVYDAKPLQGTAKATLESTGEDGTIVKTDVPVQYSTDGGENWSDKAPSITDVGELKVQVKTNSENVEEATASYTLTVTKRPITVSDAATKTYTGKAQTLKITADKAAAATETTGVVDGETLTLTGAAVTGTEVGEYTEVSSYTWSVAKADESDSTGNYEIKVEGKLTIKKAGQPEIVVKDDDGNIIAEGAEKVYDGKALKGTAEATLKTTGEDGAEIVTPVPVVYSTDGETWTEEIPSITDAGEITVQVKTNSANVEEASTSFTLKVTKRPVTVSDTASKTYNGKEQSLEITGDKAKAATDTTGLVEGETLTLTGAKVSGTNVGVYTEVGEGYTWSVAKEDGTDSTGNYDVKVEGKLTITKAGQPEIVVTNDEDGEVIAKGAEKVYDGQPLKGTAAATLSVTGEDGETSELEIPVQYSTDGGETWADEAPSLTDVGKLTVQVKTNSENVEEATASYTLTVTKRPITVDDTATKTYTGAPQTLTITAEKAAAAEETTGVVDGETLTLTGAAVTGTDAGKYTDVSNYTWSVAKEDGSDSTGNYTIKVTGTLTINQKAITVKAKDATKVYDATALKAEDAGYEITDGELVEGETEEVVLSGEQTLVGSSPAKVDSVVIKKGDADVTKNYKIEMADGTLTVTDGTDPEDEKPVDDDLVVTKTVDDKEYKLGETVTFAVTATNIYAEAKDITLTEIDGVTLETAVFEAVEPGATVETTATYVITEADILAGEFKNTVTAEVGNVTKKAEATAKTEAKNGHLTIEKVTTSETPETGYPLGDTIDYKITVKNDGNLTITDIYVTDELTGDQWMIKSMKPGESKDYEASYTVTEADVLAGEVVNVATGKGTSPDPEKPDVPVEPGKDPEPTEEMNGHLTVNKVTTSETPEGGYMVGDKVEYKITVTNDGNLTITDITVKDDLTGDEWELEFLEPGESKDYEASYTVTEDDAEAGKVENVATAKGTSPDPEKPDVPVENGKVTVPVGSEELALIYNITYKLNGGVYDGSTEDIVEQYPDGTVISIHEAPTREGYVFDYWKGSEYQPGDKYTVTGDHVFVAQWKEAEKEKTPAKKHSKSEDSDDDDSSPRTGDDNHAGLWILLLLAAAAGTLGASIYRKKNRK